MSHAESNRASQTVLPDHGFCLNQVKQELADETATANASGVESVGTEGERTAEQKRAEADGAASKRTAAAKDADTKQGEDKSKHNFSYVFTDDKPFYNKFRFRIAQAPDFVNEEWLSLKKGKNHEEIMEFVNNVLQMKKGKLPEDFLRKYKKNAKEEMTGIEGRWNSYKEMVDLEGEDVLMEMVRAKSIETRPHPKLPADTNIPYPKNQMFKYVKEVFSSKRKITEGEDHEQQEDVDSEKLATFSEKLETSMGSNSKAAKTGTHLERGPAAATLPKDTDDETAASRTAIHHVRKTHSAFDRARRNWSAVLAKSKENVNTKGCKFEQDLEASLGNGKCLDAKLMEIERIFMTDGKLANMNITAAADISNKLVNEIKFAGKRVAALQNCFKVF
jgi:hypothetical protein